MQTKKTVQKEMKLKKLKLAVLVQGFFAEVASAATLLGQSGPRAKA
jgi:hypothetical protein